MRFILLQPRHLLMSSRCRPLRFSSTRLLCSGPLQSHHFAHTPQGLESLQASLQLRRVHFPAGCLRFPH